MTFRTTEVKQMYFYNRQKLSFMYETDWGLSFNTALKSESNRPTGDLIFKKLPTVEQAADGTDPGLVNRIRTTEWSVGLRYCPGQTYINTKQQRLPVNLDAPEFTLNHTMGIQNFLGGQYKLNLTTMGIYKRFWLGTWGYVDTHLNGGAQWNKVPFPLLIMPPTNLTYFELENTFSMMKNMEFLSDRYAYASVSWDISGKLLNRVPLLKHLKWREYVAVKGMWSTLTDKNNPMLAQNANDPLLMQFPAESRVMDKKTPYVEIVAGVHNIFKFFGVDYVRRLTYINEPGIHRNGVRFSFMLSF